MPTLTKDDITFVSATPPELTPYSSVTWQPSGDVLYSRPIAPYNMTPPTIFTNGAKPSNPKDIIGSDKLPLHLWPETATALGSLGLLDGLLKYGRSNFRAIGVKTTIYIDACRRHLNAYFEGEDVDPDSGLSHLSHALACLAIIVDADAAGVLTDDRQYPGGYRQLVTKLTPEVARLKEKYASRPAPKHWTIADAPLGESAPHQPSDQG